VTTTLSVSWEINGVTLEATSGVAYQLIATDGREGRLYEVTAPARTFISQLACRGEGELYAFSAPIERDGVAYLFVWRDGRSRAFFMGACANFGLVEEYLPTPVPPTATPVVPTDTPRWKQRRRPWYLLTRRSQPRLRQRSRHRSHQQRCRRLRPSQWKR